MREDDEEKRERWDLGVEWEMGEERWFLCPIYETLKGVYRRAGLGFYLHANEREGHVFVISNVDQHLERSVLGCYCDQYCSWRKVEM